ncbi:bifunctional aldolase/short-chain dehydrogenase [Flammeovirgaceae bacterium SG7u.111]|nr:bifunctional aldolase/short-chain dehydrogenase [Flammeovirgaceae bacterium SG7u.132]WPO34347.1 bifunctional aldolase/short-chain dehydrogenase [Flammeovirgaceae bacterium SG7u.111]
MKKTASDFKYVDYLWDDEKAASFGDDQVALLLYRSNILGADLRITNYGGGNTSCKTVEKDPLTGEDTEVMWVKGSGGDIGTLKRSGLAGLYVDKLRALENVYKGIEFEDPMVALFNHCIYDLDSKAPSIDTPLHGFLPFKHIDHLHPDAAIAIAASKDGKQITKEIWGDTITWIPWQKPGFDLGLQLRDAVAAKPDIRGIMLGGHGLFTWDDDAYKCYINSLEVIEMASAYLEANYGKKGPVFGGARTESLPADQRTKQASVIAPVLRGLCSSYQQMVGHFTDDERVLEFANSHDIDKLAPLGTSCPDHFLRTKIRPLVLDIPAVEDVSDWEALKERLAKPFEEYRQYYTDYYENHKHDNSPAIRDRNPVVIIWPGVGMFTYAKNKQTARVASEFYINAINVMKGAEAISEYVALPLQEAFNIEYWLLEEAKLQRMPKEKPLSRKVALVSGSAGGIGLAIAEKFIQEGACVVITDIDGDRVVETNEELKKKYGRDASGFAKMDVTSEEDIALAFEKASLEFGGVDIVVHSAGLAISKPLLETENKDWDLLYDVLVKGQFMLGRKGAEIFKKQDLGGDIVNIVSKNAYVSGPNNVGYGSAKGAQAHMSRLLAAELAPDKVRVNVVNPDAVIEGSKIWEGKWAEGRAKAYGITVEELPAFYAKRNLMNEIIGTKDIANAVFCFVGGELSKCTGNVLNVDGGVGASFPR